MQVIDRGDYVEKIDNKGGRLCVYKVKEKIENPFYQKVTKNPTLRRFVNIKSIRIQGGFLAQKTNSLTVITKDFYEEAKRIFLWNQGK